MKSSWVYIILCSDGSYYTGCTTNLEKRIRDHKNGTFKGYTSTRLPVKLMFSEEFHDTQYAICAERQIKKWTRKKKETLIKGDFRLFHELASARTKHITRTGNQCNRHVLTSIHPSTPLPSSSLRVTVQLCLSAYRPNIGKIWSIEFHVLNLIFTWTYAGILLPHRGYLFRAKSRKRLSPFFVTLGFLYALYVFAVNYSG